jgi:hypothetical protein
MAVLLRMVGKVGERVIDVTAEHILTVIKSRRSFVGRNHSAMIYNLAFCVSPTNFNMSFFNFLPKVIVGSLLICQKSIVARYILLMPPLSVADSNRNN